MDNGNEYTTDSCDTSSDAQTSVVPTQATSQINPSYEFNRRLQTYEGWSSQKDKVQLAKAGFTYTGTADKVECLTCGVRLYNWKPDEDPILAHKKYGPDCGFMLQNFPEVKAPPKPKKPTHVRHPHFSDYEARLNSFVGWPKRNIQQSPEYMARSGFFYVGSADRARCFHCGITLRDWDVDDYPPCAHKQWSDQCPFIQQINVIRFRDEIQEADRVEKQRIEQLAYQSSDYVDISDKKRRQQQPAVVPDCSRTVPSAALETPASVVEVDGSRGASNTDDLVTDPIVLACVEMGVELDDIMKVIEESRRQGRGEFTKASALLMAIENS